MKFNELPMADVLELQTLDHTRQALADDIAWAKEQGRFSCDIKRGTYDGCKEELKRKGYYVEYNMPYGFRVHWNAETIKCLKENLEEIRTYRKEQEQKRLSKEKPKGSENVIIPSWSSKFMRLFK